MRLKVTALFLSFLMVLSFVAVPIGVGAADTYGNQEEKLAILSALDIVDITEANFKERSFVKRDDFLTGVFGLLGMDVPHEQLVSMAADYGLINRATAEEYGTASLVTFDQAYKILSIALGYEVLAQEQGGYPFGYGMVARYTGIRDGISGDGETNITQGDFVTMLYNALFASRLESDYNPDDPALYVNPDATLLHKQFQVYRVDGVLTANEFTGLYVTDGLEKPCVEIGGEVYAVGTTNAADFLGYSVTAYVRENAASDFDDLIYVKQKQNRELTIDAEELLSVSDDLREIQYQPDGESIKTVRMTAGVSVIYNNKLSANTDKKDFQIRDGYISLISNNDSGNYNVVKIYSYDTMVVDTVSTTLKRVSNLYGNIAAELGFDLKYLELDENSTDYTVKIYLRDGTPLDLKQLKKGDVLNVLKSKMEQGHTGIVDVMVNRESGVYGTLQAYDDEYLLIDGLEYPYIEEFGKYMRGSSSNEKLELGKDYDFYLNSRGRVAAVTGDLENANQEEYVYLRRTGREGFFRYKLQYMDVNGDWHEDVLNDAVRFNKQKRDAEDVIAELSQEQVIKIRKNSEGLISSIRTATMSETSNKDEFIYNTFSGSYRNNNSLNSTLYFNDKNTTVFVLPMDLNTATQKDYYAESASWFQADQQYTVTAYDFDEYNFTQLVTIQASTSSAITRGTAYIVQDVVQTLDDTGMETSAITVTYSSYVDLMMYPAEGVSLEGIRKGDILYLAQNQRGEIIDYEIFYSPSDGILYSTMNTQTAYSVAAGTIEKIDYENRRMTVDCGGIKQNIKMLESTVVTICDEVTETVSRAGVAELSEGDYVMVRMTWANISGILVFRGK